MNKKTVFIFILFVFILMCVVFLRFLTGMPLLTGDLPFKHLQLAQAFWHQGIVFTDTSIGGGRLVFATPFHVFIAFFAQFFPSQYVILVVTFVSRILTFLFLASIIKKILPRMQYCYLFLYAISIPVIATMASPSPLAFVLFLYVASMYAYLNNKHRCTAALFFLFSLHGIFENFLSIATLYFLSRIKKQEPSSLFFFLLLFFCAFQVPFSFFTTTVMTYSSSSIAEFGGFMSESIFFLLLSVVGVLFIWSSRKQHYAIYLFFFVLFILSLFYPVLLPYANYFIVYLAAHTLSLFTRIRFHLKYIKPLFFLFLFTSLFMEPLFFIHQITVLPPDKELMTLLKTEVSFSPATFFSSPDVSFYIAHAGHTVVLDNYPFRYRNTGRIRALYHDVLRARELATLQRTLESLNVTHVLLTPEHKQQYPRFAQLLTNNETFKRIHATDRYILYEYIP